MKLILHAGIHRTGTTSLQRFLVDNRDALASRGIHFPGYDKDHQKLAWAIKRGDADHRDVEAILDPYGETGTAILSAEDFAIHQDLTWVKALAKRYEVHLIMYLRRQDHWIMSWYNQHVKWPFARRKSQMDPQEFLATIDDFHWLDYEATLGLWADAVGEAGVHVGVLEKGAVEDTTRDFLTRLGVAEDGLDFTRDRQNDALPVQTLEIARHLGLFDMRPRRRMRVLQALRAAHGDKPGAAGTVYSPAERRGILEKYAPSNRAVAQRYLGCEELFNEAPPADDDPWFRFPDMPRDEFMREWIAPVIVELLGQKR